MYEVDGKDRVVELMNVPRSSVGAPIPWVLAKEGQVVIAYYVERRDPNWDGTTVRMVSETSDGEPIAIVRFNRVAAHMFGPPNDEAFQGHPLASHGLQPYRVFCIENSSWIRKLERMNSVHRQHRPERYVDLQHLIFAFHDSTFECVCKSFTVTQTSGSIVGNVPEMVRILRQRDI